MDYNSLLKKIKNYKKKYDVKVLGKTSFGRNIYAVERILSKDFFTAIFVAGVHGREHITTDLVCKMLDDNLFDSITNFNLAFVLMANPDGVELSANGLVSAPHKKRKNLLKINNFSTDFSMWKANGEGVDINNNFDANFGQNAHAHSFAPSGFCGNFPECAIEAKILSNYTKSLKTFFTLSYHSKGEEIYFNFFQTEKALERDSLIAHKFQESTGYLVKNVEASSSGGYKDFCVMKLGIPALTIEIGNDNLSHPISASHLPEIFERHKTIATDLEFAYNVFIKFNQV